MHLAVGDHRGDVGAELRVARARCCDAVQARVLKQLRGVGALRAQHRVRRRLEELAQCVDEGGRRRRGGRRCRAAHAAARGARATGGDRRSGRLRALSRGFTRLTPSNTVTTAAGCDSPPTRSRLGALDLALQIHVWGMSHSQCELRQSTRVAWGAHNGWAAPHAPGARISRASTRGGGALGNGGSMCLPLTSHASPERRGVSDCTWWV